MSQTPPQGTEPQIIDGRYRVVRALGEGGMGAVVECLHIGTKRPFAVKLIHPEIARKAGAFQRFQREAEAAGTIRSVHVVDINDVGLDRTTGSAFMAMELLSGEDLGKHLEQRGRIAPDLVLRIVAQALMGLGAAHKAGVVHRDIKPSNLFLARRPDNPLASGAVWVDGERVVKVLDFGIAKVAAEDDPKTHKLTKTGGILGSPSYMSPEQAGGLPEIDRRSDIWSLGAVMYEALSGTTPYHGARSALELIRQICHGPPEPLSLRLPGAPLGVAAIVTRAMAHDPANRYQSAEEMLADVRALLNGSAAITEAMLAEPSWPAAGAAGPISGVAGPPKPGVATGTLAMPGAAAVAGGATQAALGRTVPPQETRRWALLAVAVLAVCGAVAGVALAVLPKPTPSGTASDTGPSGGTTTLPVQQPTDGGDPLVPVQEADAGGEPDADAAAPSGPDAGTGPASGPAPKPNTGPTAHPAVEAPGKQSPTTFSGKRGI